ncbi:HK97 family phage prohead protease [Prosthecomicrobium hirschii]|uniref:HK97 family phage prohead protease n=1 Tax=Prosthecodimorpha hirschii TaxID=665126 RepID=UPI00221EAB07|nr:HK97 family phage prohead protease [Prosthecomicrobium hirschii]MCW1844132.1 HK97 family phage prohead protease [Prosthecomicrobium hirschii]
MAQSDGTVSVDEFMNARKSFVKGDRVMKALKTPPSWDDATRSARFVMSSENPDRDNDIIVQAGINLDSFSLNPVALLFHCATEFPVGKWEKVEKVLSGRPRRTEGTLVFVPEGVDDDADKAAAHVKFGTLRTVSIGFIPKTIRMLEQSDPCCWPGFEIQECELVECSLVPVPANPDAIVKAVKDGTLEFRAGRDLVEEILDTYVKTPAGLILPRAEVEAAYKTIVGEKTSVVIDVRGTDAAGVEHVKAALDAVLTKGKPEDGMADEDSQASMKPEDCAEDSAKDSGETVTPEDPDEMVEESCKPKKTLRDRFEAIMKRLGLSTEQPAPVPLRPVDPSVKAALAERLAKADAKTKALTAS